MVRHDDQRSLFDYLLDRLDQLFVQLGEVVLDCREEKIGMRLDIRRLQMKLGELKRETLQRSSNRGRGRKVWHHIKAIVPNDECVKSITDRVVLHQYFIRQQHRLYFFDFGKLHALQGGPS